MKRANQIAKAGLCAFLAAYIFIWAESGTTDDNQLQRGNQIREYEAEIPKTVVELQQFRETISVQVKTKTGREGTASLTNLNPAINVMYLLKLAWKDGTEVVYHLENPNPQTRKLILDAKYPSNLIIVEGTNRYPCDLFDTKVFDQATSSPRIFQPLCAGQIYLRNSAMGHRTTLESSTEFLREHVWGGERIIALGHILMGGIHRETGRIEFQPPLASRVKNDRAAGDYPRRALIDSKYAESLLTSNNLGIRVEGLQETRMTPGTWYQVQENPGVYVSILRPNLIDPQILQSYKTEVNSLDSIELSALCYLIAFDLDRFDLGYAMGTEHPSVEWSARIMNKIRNPTLPGPDGIGRILPWVTTGLVSPENAHRTVATFTGGFKRIHGAFRYGDLAVRNRGSHYGFIENGAVFSKLQPGLATILVLDDGSVEMKTWTDADNKRLAKIRHARQNGVPVIERNNISQQSSPGALVGQWGAGNWSGSEEGKLRTMRSGLAIQKTNGRRFLLYSVFSDATPSAMARVFQSYRCDYAMLLDMNALEHTYLALYRRSGAQMFVDHLLKGMSVLEKPIFGEIVPRFLGYADNRDFFYVMKRSGEEAKP